MLVAKYFFDGWENVRLERLDLTLVTPLVRSHGVANIGRSQRYSFTKVHKQDATLYDLWLLCS